MFYHLQFVFSNILCARKTIEEENPTYPKRKRHGTIRSLNSRSTRCDGYTFYPFQYHVDYK